MVRRGAATKASRHIDEDWTQMITCINLTINTTFQTKPKHFSPILSHSHCSHSL
jgi:hypothetical protein